MLRNDVFSVVSVTAYFVLSVILIQFEITRSIGLVMSLFSPFLLCWMIYTILKYGKYTGPDLGKDEYGYLDNRKAK